MDKKKEHPKVKSRLHKRNKHRERYDFKALIESSPELSEFVALNKYGDESVDFFDPKAVKALNKALLKHHYDISFWDIPEGYLCPPIPGRADYIHNLGELLSRSNFGNIPEGDKIRGLDIGVGANCIYPILGTIEYGWSFIGADIDPVSIDSANKIVDENSNLKGKIELRLQNNSKDIFHHLIDRDEKFDFTLCNPPFHASLEEAQSGTKRKLNNLTHKKVTKATLNFGGQNNELWCEGGESKFIKEMIRESKHFAENCFWFSTLISKNSNVDAAVKQLEKLDAVEIKNIPMGQGNKTSRVIAWTFLTKETQNLWMKNRWK